VHKFIHAFIAERADMVGGSVMGERSQLKDALYYGILASDAVATPDM
jgi:hypothetical protein